ncbi:hypothetical protein [Desmospora activa]|uniref:DUF2637 domain-containing protein n=1 Tax=Desmospora activa DSM 45169 TaxID=1121389 RepID=A0A2T4YYF1_9BACL|nr:hypothetical protein [Desmospora activa]PTM51508.1 hypothetical protein C8J48_3771 [Desmospora activa DSM 45169]
MRWYLGILGILIFGAGSLMSWGHTAEFFADNGFGKGYDPIFGVVLVECLFLMGAGAEIYMRKTGQRSTWSIKFALWVGGATVFWANLRYGWDYGWEGMVAGTIIIVAIVIAENVLADIVLAIQQGRTAQDAVPESGTPVPVAAPEVDETVPVTMDGVPDNGRESGTTVPDNGESVPVTSDAVPVKWDSVPDNGQESGTPVPDAPPNVPAVPVHDGTTVPDTPAAQLYMYHRENGKFPGRVRLARICGMDDREARRALGRMNNDDATLEVEQESA